MAVPDPQTNQSPDFVGIMWNAVTDLFTSQPWLAAVLALVVVSGLVRSARVAIHSSPRDPVRTLTRADKRVLLDRAGHRCEHHAAIFGRCRETERLEADHVHPHSRGGWTHVSNGQILCHRHNREKSAAIPWNRSLRRLSERRVAYYPTDVDRLVVRRGPRQVARTGSRNGAA